MPLPVIMWFRADLRLADNPALRAACQSGALLPIYILEDEDAGHDAMGAASRLWLHHSLGALNQSLDGKLQLFRGKAEAIIEALCEAHNIKEVHWNRAYEPWRMTRDTALKATLTEKAITAQSHKANLLWEPWEVSKNDGTPYKVFTPFYRRGCLSAQAPRRPLDSPHSITFADITSAESLSLTSLSLLPNHNWHKDVISQWQVGETGAKARFETFLDTGIDHYTEGRNIPDKPYVQSMLVWRT